jgi:hypothetical protein
MMLYSSTVTLPSTFFFVCIASSFFILNASSFFVPNASWRPLGKTWSTIPKRVQLIALPAPRCSDSTKASDRSGYDCSLSLDPFSYRGWPGRLRRWGARWIRCKLAAQDQRLQAVNGRIRRIVCPLGGKEQPSESNLSSTQKKCLKPNRLAASL